MKTGIELITEERQRQIEIEGYSVQHDSQHNASELIYAAIAYVESAKVGVNCSEMGNTDEHEIMRRKTEMGRYYPFGWSFKPSTDIRDLVKAGALIAAAIDRLESTSIIMKTNEPVDFFSVHSREEVAEIDKRIERKQKEFDAKLRDKMMKVKDFPMTD